MEQNTQKDSIYVELNNKKNQEETIWIVRADEPDLPEILSLQKLAYQTEAELYGTQDIPPLKQTLEALQQDQDSSTILKAVVGDRLVGSVRAVETDGVCQIKRLFVHPEFRNKGIGKKLMGRIESRFPECRSYELFTGSRSKQNLDMYHKLGYQDFKKETLSDQIQFVYLKKENPLHMDSPL